ncbi:MAG: VWA domain-containing protein [Xanthomonadales bacterium]|nr:VWA domain-containing protein [Gammaproteobacteria bacterium]MBT8049787.1 VWA domain-containing protein [Gammaproteobacteria bacterium]MBT8057870.1 VWA domain-containing protein [Gammaproteobacteria bacterium]NNJ79978.1 VWA domain-containing protein [Xanthomonadales bacterium]NNL03691.1 VWA domain-containing protein [Xanthomonadales bacterium]
MNAGLIHFIRPGWLLLLPLVVLLPWAWRRMQRASGDWARVCDPHLLRWLSIERAGDDGRRSTGPWLAGLALLVTILALSGPSWQKLPDTSYSARDARVLAVDLSRSMLAEDLRPNRLIRARYRLADLLASTEEGQVGMVAYAGDAYVVSPLTNDMNTIANLLPALRPDIIPVAGSRPDRALELAASLFERSGLARGEVLLVTDSVDTAARARARSLREVGIITSVLAVGTLDGAPIPSGGGFVSDRAGNVVIARLQRPDLQELARAGGGAYTELGPALSEAKPWGAVEGAGFELREDVLGERWKDAGPWLVLLLIPLALAGFRRGLFFVLPLLLSNALFLPTEARADWWDDLWMRKDQQAWQALQNDQPQQAAALAQNPALSGEAWYRSGEYANAADAWRDHEGTDADYNLGNALAQQGDLDGAIAAYDRALEQDPDMLDAIYNRNLVEKLKDQQEQQQREEGDPGESDSSDEQQQGDEEQESQEGGQDEEGQESDSQESPQESEKDEASGQQTEQMEQWTEEDAQAMEQWLRRIPDDPGGLLRRKFRNQHQRRGAPDDERESW